MHPQLRYIRCTVLDCIVFRQVGHFLVAFKQSRRQGLQNTCPQLPQAGSFISSKQTPQRGFVSTSLGSGVGCLNALAYTCCPLSLCTSKALATSIFRRFAAGLRSVANTDTSSKVFAVVDARGAGLLGNAVKSTTSSSKSTVLPILRRLAGCTLPSLALFRPVTFELDACLEEGPAWACLRDGLSSSLSSTITSAVS